MRCCASTWIGYWKDISPDDVIRAKRDLDRTFHIYRYLFDDDVYDAYHTYIHALFDVHTAAMRGSVRWSRRPTAIAACTERMETGVVGSFRDRECRAEGRRAAVLHAIDGAAARVLGATR